MHLLSFVTGFFVSNVHADSSVTSKALFCPISDDFWLYNTANSGE